MIRYLSLANSSCLLFFKRVAYHPHAPFGHTLHALALTARIYAAGKDEIKCDKNEDTKKEAYVDNKSTASQAVKKKKSYAEAINSQNENEEVKEKRNKVYELNESKGLIKLKQSSFNQ